MAFVFGIAFVMGGFILLWYGSAGHMDEIKKAYREGRDG